MSKKWLSLIIVLVGFWLGGCGPSPESETADIPPIPPPPPVKPEPESTEPKEEIDRVAVSGLIPPTNAQQRAEGIPRGLDNPFSSLSPVPIVTITDDQIPTEEQLPEPPPSASEDASSPNGETEINLELAKSVVVTGIVNLGDSIQVILKAPKENFSRYVELGQYISDGAVLVKRIEKGYDRSVFVILEQSGVEVRKSVGLDPAQSESSPEA
jgi:hypothetical protein